LAKGDEKKMDRVEKEVNEILTDWKEQFQKWGVNLVEVLEAVKLSEEKLRETLRILVEVRLKYIPQQIEKAWLMAELSLSLKEVEYIIENRCLIGPTKECDYYRKHGKCGSCCTNLNGWLFIKTSPNGKIRPNWKAWSQLPKDTLSC